jgi:hypothetical protein
MPASLWAEMAATWAFSSRVDTGRDSACRAPTATRVPRSSPRFRSMALAPATTLRMPSAMIAWARMVEVLVPSPTTSPVRSAAWRSIWAPRFSSGSFSSNSLAMVTPSLQTSGAPHLRWISTDFDFGPSVTRMASASWVVPRSTFSRAAERKSTFLCAIGRSSRGDATGAMPVVRRRECPADRGGRLDPDQVRGRAPYSTARLLRRSRR